MEEITYQEAKQAKETLIKYLKQNDNCNGFDGEDVYGRYSKEYLVLIALNQDYFLE